MDAAPPAPITLDLLPSGRRAKVVAVDGADPVAARLVAVGFWPGAIVERITAAPFGGPVLFRLHGYRLALRRVEAARVRIAELHA